MLIRYSSAPATGCAGRAPAVPRSMWAGVLPSLPPPPGAIVISSGGGSSGRQDVQQTAELHSALSPAQLLEHYGGHMREQGWTPVNRLSGNTWP